MGHAIYDRMKINLREFGLKYRYNLSRMYVCIRSSTHFVINESIIH